MPSRKRVCALPKVALFHIECRTVSFFWTCTVATFTWAIYFDWIQLAVAVFIVMTIYRCASDFCFTCAVHSTFNTWNHAFFCRKAIATCLHVRCGRRTFNIDWRTDTFVVVVVDAVFGTAVNHMIFHEISPFFFKIA